MCICFISGGSSQETGLGITIAQWASLPLLLWAAAHAWLRGRLQACRWAVLVALAIIALPVAQLLPIPAGLWQMPTARIDLMQDLDALGVSTLHHRWSLSPAATERNALLLLPSLALFFSMLALDRAAWRTLLWCIIGLVLFSLILAFVQLGQPQDSIFNPFSEFAPSMAGVFANKNHQSIALAIGLMLSLGFLLDALRKNTHRDPPRASIALCIALAVVFGLVLPLVNSRAGILIAMVGTALIVLASGTFTPAHWRERPFTRWLAALAAVMLALGVWGAFAWIQGDIAIQGSRKLLIATTWQLGWANAPLGSGFGSFVPMFEQATQGALMHNAYINNAHNDFVQWWFEGGVAALVVMLGALLVLANTTSRLLRLPAHSRSRLPGLSALTGIAMLALHSTVDYPLRTPALLAVFAVLAGIAVAAANRTRTPG